MWVVVPVKSFALAKRRLSSILSEQERAELAATMLVDLLTMLNTTTHVSGVLMVSGEPEARALAGKFNAVFLPEETRGLSTAVAQAGDYLAARGEHSFLMLPSDVPLAAATEIDALIEGHPEAPSISIVSDLEGYGTNAIAVSPPLLMPFLFGQRSFFAHRHAAEALSAQVRVVHASGLALDIDTPEDLRRLFTYEVESQTLSLLCDLGVASRLVPRHNVQRANAGQ